MGAITFYFFKMAQLVLLWYGAGNSVNYRAFYTNKHQRGRKQHSLQTFEGKYAKLFVFVRKKTRFCRTGKTTNNELYKSKQTQLLAKISRSDG